ncbi:hypothetical protein, partial [Enterobacter hormaechei]|uniref:hypothetical protein n=1 Tax=Enterobacter hormaechei TaxID=158836 RepID=UPI00203BF1F2
ALGYASGENPFTAYRDIMYSVAVSRGVEFFSLYDFMPISWAVSKALIHGLTTGTLMQMVQGFYLIILI